MGGRDQGRRRQAHDAQRVREELAWHGFTELPATLEDGLAAGALPRHHSDPFDRMLVAQATRRRFVLVTADRRFADYDVPTLS